MLATLTHYARLVRLSHTIFGLPFTLASAGLAHRHSVQSGAPGLDLVRLAWILVAFAGARTAAMGFNRIADRNLDAANPRTAARELPIGAITVRAASLLTAAAAGAFVFAAFQLGPLPGQLALPCLVVVLGYSLLKRFTWVTHGALGLALALAPGGAWIAVTGSFSGWMVPALLMAAVATWVAGFDILYSLQDRSFDRDHGLHSIPARFGARQSLRMSRTLHGVTVVSLATLHMVAGLGGAHAAGVMILAGLLAYEQSLVRANDLSRIDKAFFDLNGWVSIVYLLCLALDLGFFI